MCVYHVNIIFICLCVYVYIHLYIYMEKLLIEHLFSHLNHISFVKMLMYKEGHIFFQADEFFFVLLRPE